MKILDVPQSGSLGGQTSSHNRAGQYRRARRTPVSPTRTDKQGVIRGRFGSASAAWQSLTTAVQNAWTSFAANYPVVDSLGQSIVLTGQQYFIGLQSSLMNAGQDMNTAIPTNTNTPAIDTPVLYADASGCIIATVGSIVAGDFNLVGVSKVLSNGKNFNKTFSQFAVLTNTENIADLSTVFARQYGAPTLGKKLFARFKEVNSDGMSGPALILQTPVLAASTLAAPTVTAGGTSIVTAAAALPDGNLICLFLADPPDNYGQLSNQSPITGGSVDFVDMVPGTKVYGRYLLAGVWSLPSPVVTVV